MSVQTLLVHCPFIKGIVSKTYQFNHCWFIALLSRAVSINPINSNPDGSSTLLSRVYMVNNPISPNPHCSLPFYQGHGSIPCLQSKPPNPVSPKPQILSVQTTKPCQSNPIQANPTQVPFFSVLLVCSALQLFLLPRMSWCL